MEEYLPYLVKHLIGVIVTLCFARLKEYLPERKESKKDESYEFIRGFMAQGLGGRSHVVVEHAFKKYLKISFNYSEIMRLVNLQNPLRAFELYKKARFMVEYNEFTGYFEYKEKYSSKSKRVAARRQAFGQYLLYGYLAFMTILYTPNLLNVNGLQNVAFILFFLFLLLPMAWLMIEESTYESAAESFMSFIEGDPKYEFNKAMSADTELPPL